MQGFSQIPGVDCGGTVASTCRLQSIRMVPAIKAELDYEVHMSDAQTEFLNADVEEEVLVKMVPTYDINDRAIVLATT